MDINRYILKLCDNPLNHSGYQSDLMDYHNISELPFEFLCRQKILKSSLLNTADSHSNSCLPVWAVNSGQQLECTPLGLFIKYRWWQSSRIISMHYLNFALETKNSTYRSQDKYIGLGVTSLNLCQPDAKTEKDWTTRMELGLVLINTCHVVTHSLDWSTQQQHCR